MPSSALYGDLDRGVEAAPCFPVVVGHRADALELPWPSPEATEALSLLTEPVVLRGGARSFLSEGREEGEDEDEEEEEDEEEREGRRRRSRCRWSLDALARADPARRVLVRAAPTPSFPVPNGDLLPLVVAAFGAAAAPSLASPLPLREAAWRMQAGCRLPPLAYSSNPTSASLSSFLSSFFPSLSSSSFDVVSDGTEGGRREWYYIQSEVPREWIERGGGERGGSAAADSSPLSAPFLLPGAEKEEGGASKSSSSSGSSSGGGGRITQDFRLWLAPPNAVSPLHWDASRSCLAVLRGNKTLHFWRPEETFGALGPRSDWGLLRRRCAADPAERGGGGGGFWWPWRGSSSSSSSCPPAALRAVVRAGDAVAFPPFWAHHVLSHNDGDGEEEEEEEEGDEGRRRRRRRRGSAGGAGGGVGGGSEVGGGECGERRRAAPTGRPIVALTRRASSGVARPPPSPPRRVFVRGAL